MLASIGNRTRTSWWNVQLGLRLICSSALMTLLALDLACSSSQQAVGPGVGPLHGIVVSPDSAVVNVRGTQTFSATAHDAAGAIVTGVTFSWSSSDTAIATVDQNGRATAVDTGQVRLAASAQGISGFATLTVTPVPVGSVVVAPATDTIAIGSQIQLSDTVKGVNGSALNMPVMWMSSSTNVASVSTTGKVLGGSAGTVTITASVGGKTGSNSTVVIDTAGPASISLGINPDSSVSIPNPLDVLVQVTATVKTVSGRVLNNFPVVFTSTNPPVSGFLGQGQDTVVGGSITIVPDTNGRAVITAAAGPITAQANLTVCYAASTPICNPFARIEVVPATDTLTVGDGVSMEAVGVDSSGIEYAFPCWSNGTPAKSSRLIPVAWLSSTPTGRSARCESWDPTGGRVHPELRRGKRRHGPCRANRVRRYCGSSRGASGSADRGGGNRPTTGTGRPQSEAPGAAPAPRERHARRQKCQHDAILSSGVGSDRRRVNDAASGRDRQIARRCHKVCLLAQAHDHRHKASGMEKPPACVHC